MKIFEQQKDQLYTNNESKLSGLYPLGKGSFWHSGIHLHLDSPITTAFEGDVVAYYIADKYQVNSKGKNVSKSFVLMRHNINLMKGSENTENSQIEFFSLYTSLLPDSEMKVVKDFKESKELTNSNKNMNLPFYKDVKFTINQSKCNSYRKLKNDDFYVGARGNIVDGSYLTKRKLEDKNNIQLGNKKIVLPLKAVKLENSDKYYDVKVEKDSVEYFPVNTDSKIFFSRGTIKVGTVFCCSSEPTVVKNENYYKIKSNGKILKNKEKSGYIFQCETYKNNPSSDYAYVNEKLKYSILYDVTEIEDRKNFFFICKYSELKKFITDVNNISGIKAFFANLGFGINKEQLNRDITENIKLKSSKEEYKDDDIIFICNNKYDWNDNKISKDRVKQIFYDISFKNKLSSYAIFYVSEKVYGDISNNVKEYSEKSLNLVKLSAIKENQEQFACSIESENVEIDSKNNISLLTNNLLYHVKTHLPTSYDTEWLVKGSDLTLLSGPDVVLVDDGKSFTNTAKGLMLYDKNNKKSPCLLIDKESDSFIVSDYKSFIENSNNDLQLINYNGTEYYVNVSGVEQLKAQVINKIGFSVDSVIKPSGDNGIFLSKDRVLGFASEKDGTKSFDFITFTKDSSFFDTKDKLIIRIPKENAEIRSVAKKSNKTIQRLPYKSTLKIIGKEEIFGHYYYKVKYYLMPVWFSKESLTAKGNKYTIKEDIDSVWISFLKIKSDGKCSGENSWASNEQISLLKDLISNNFEKFRGKEFSFIEKNNEGSSYSLAVDFESVSGTYYIDDISNFTLNEKEQILTIQKRTKDFTLYETVPFVVEKVSDLKQIKSICDSYNCDEGALLKYETGEYYSLVKKDSNVNPDKDYYIKKTDIEEKNL